MMTYFVLPLVLTYWVHKH